jgi:hypothetical protein
MEALSDALTPEPTAEPAPELTQEPAPEPTSDPASAAAVTPALTPEPTTEPTPNAVSALASGSSSESVAGAASEPADDLTAFSEWLRGMGGEVLRLCGELERQELPDEVRRASAESLAYLLHTVPLIPDGVEELGYLDVLFRTRAICARGAGAEPTGSVAAIGREASRVRRFLGDDFERFVAAGELPRGVRGATISQIMNEPEARAGVAAEARAWASEYIAPELRGGDEELVKIRAFMRTRALRHAA